jgi:hypothetical protein
MPWTAFHHGGHRERRGEGRQLLVEGRASVQSSVNLNSSVVNLRSARHSATPVAARRAAFNCQTVSLASQLRAGAQGVVGRTATRGAPCCQGPAHETAVSAAKLIAQIGAHALVA